MAISSLLDVQVREIVKKRKRIRAIVATSLALTVYLVVLATVILLSPFVPYTTQLYVVIIGALAGVSAGIAFYMMESYPAIPENFVVHGKIVGNVVGLAGIDAYLVSQLSSKGSIDVSSLAKRYKIDKSLIVSRILALERAGVIQVDRVETY